jgi:hypothetical protein
MTEPALNMEQSVLLRQLFAEQIVMACHCAKSHHCVRCRRLDRIRTAFPGTFTQACVDAANIKQAERENG